MNDISGGDAAPLAPPEKMRGYLPHYLSRFMNVIDLRLLESLRPRGITVRQFRILQMLDAREKATISEIATDTVIEQPVVSRIVDQLQRNGLAVRSRRVENARVVDVSLTPHGAQVYNELFPYAKLIVEEAVSALSREEVEQLEALVLRMFEHVTRPYEPWKVARQPSNERKSPPSPARRNRSVHDVAP